MKPKFNILLSLLAIALLLSGCSNSQTSSDGGTENFFLTVEDIQNNFIYEDFVETMEEQSHILGLPMEHEAIDIANNFIVEQKLFVYKSETEGAIIMLQMTHDKSSDNEWISSIDYDPKTFNATDSKYGSFLIDEVPNVEIASNTFSYNGCNYHTICISGDSDTSLAATTLINFSNELISFLTK